MKEFADCPFCGSNRTFGKMEIIGLEGWQHYVIVCHECGAMIAFFNDDDQSIADIINRYNRRP